jgi:SAM-dependent methyltransferase
VSNSDEALGVFRQIYASDHWKGGSGEGSEVAVTEAYRRVLAAVMRGRDVESVVDAGCGDWQFSRLVDWSATRYRGFDIVPEVVETNRSKFGSDDIRFDVADIRTAGLPAADLLICKDVLQHWDEQSIRAFLARHLGRYRYALVTNDIASVHVSPETLNNDIPIGHWRTLDLEREPFALRAQWRFDYDIRGEWTKRCLLFVRRRSRVRAALVRRSALHVCRELS